jgi:hypothetical protein
MENIKNNNTFGQILERSVQSGISGASAMGINVVTLMWMRTTINYQYRHGTTTLDAFKTLYKEGGIPRFYRGVIPALIQGPLSRFGDTAANTGTITALNTFETTANLPVWAKSASASVMAASFRIILMPIDTIKTTMQVQGNNGINNLRLKVQNTGPGVLFHGSLAAASATMVGHFPWFATYNYLQEKIPEGKTTVDKMVRNAGIGFTSTCVSDTLSNSIRVIKVYKQSSVNSIGYSEAIHQIINKDGLIGLFGRGLKTKLLSNGVQGLMFSVLWKLIDENMFTNKK